jgi:DeoR/GlpR family transcriptional regulator of sugar metabolism
LLGKEHRLTARRQSILTAVKEAGQLSVVELSTRFGVSEVTIRQDLQALSEQDLVLRTRGGAVATTVLPELTFDIRQQQRIAEKTRIGQAAAALINDRDTIVLDFGTTTLAIVPFIKHFSELTVITNNLRASMSLLDAPQIQVLLPGGKLRRPTISLVGRTANSLLKSINVQVGFFGTRGITLEEGLTDVNLDEVAEKRAMIERCQRVVAVADASKWGQVGAATFATLSKVDTIITDLDAPEDLICQVRQQQVEVIVV